MVSKTSCYLQYCSSLEVCCGCSAEGSKRFSKGAYFLAKIVYGKGWEELLELLDYHQRHNKDKQTSHPSIDAYGSGEAFETVSSLFEIHVC